MTPEPVATLLSRWAEGLAPAARDALSTYDLRALFDRVRSSLAGSPEERSRAVRHWLRQLSPAAQRALSAHDRAALDRQVGAAPVAPGPPLGAPRTPSPVEHDTPSPVPRREHTGPRPDPTGLGPPARLEHARAGGFTGDPCTACGSLAVVRSGTCQTCQDCGTQTGCG